MDRWDETWHRLREWTNGQGPSERLAAQLLSAEGYEGIDPSHPLGGRDDKRDALVRRAGEPWIMAVYFPRGQQAYSAIEKKFLSDHQGVAANSASGMAFVTNQELSLGERSGLQDAVTTPVDIFHLERITAILDRPEMHPVREQFLRIRQDAGAGGLEPRTFREIMDAAPQTPGAPGHWMIYDGMLLLRVVALSAPSGARHPHAADPRGLLEHASDEAAKVASDWPSSASLVARRIAEGWQPVAPHEWGAGHTFDSPSQLAERHSAALLFDTRHTVFVVDRTWPTRIFDDAGAFAFFAAREPEVAAETLVSLRLAGALLEPLSGLEGIDVALQIAAAPSGRTLVSSERAVSNGRFGEPAGYLAKPVAAEVPSHYHDSARMALDHLIEPYQAAEQLLSPWVTTFRDDDLLARLRQHE